MEVAGVKLVGRYRQKIDRPPCSYTKTQQAAPWAVRPQGLGNLAGGIPASALASAASDTTACAGLKLATLTVPPSAPNGVIVPPPPPSRCWPITLRSYRT